MGSLPKPYALGLRCAKLTPALTYMSAEKLADFCSGKVDGSALVTETDLAVSTAGWLNAMDLPEANYSLLTYSSDDGVGGEQMRAAATEAARRHPRSTVMSIMPHVKKFDDSLHKKNVTNLLPLRNTPVRNKLGLDSTTRPREFVANKKLMLSDSAVACVCACRGWWLRTIYAQSDDLIGRIYRSPEFFQYQMMGNILHFMHDMVGNCPPCSTRLNAIVHLDHAFARKRPPGCMDCAPVTDLIFHAVSVVDDCGAVTG